MIIQFFLTIVLLGAMFIVVKRYLERVIRLQEVVWWMGVWLIGVLIVWRPETTTVLARFVGVGRGADLVLYITVIVLLCSVFHVHVVLDRLERHVTTLVRHQALRDAGFSAEGVHEIKQDVKNTNA